jgi:hypothetical protein
LRGADPAIRLPEPAAAPLGWPLSALSVWQRSYFLSQFAEDNFLLSSKNYQNFL